MFFLTDSRLKPDGARRCREGAEDRFGVFQIQHLGVVILCGVHRFELRVAVQHMALGLDAVVAHELAGDAQLDAVRKGTELRLRVCRNLLRNGL